MGTVGVEFGRAYELQGRTVVVVCGLMCGGEGFVRAEVRGANAGEMGLAGCVLEGVRLQEEEWRSWSEWLLQGWGCLEI